MVELDPRVAKPYGVKLTAAASERYLKPVLLGLMPLTNLALIELQLPFDTVVSNLRHRRANERGKALEEFAVWLVRILGLRFVEKRQRSRGATAGAEVDVVAVSDRLIFNRWQIQCKNTVNAIGVREVAEEVGLAAVTHANVVMMVTTSRFSPEAMAYAARVTDSTQCYVILLNSTDIKKLKEDRTLIATILNAKARSAAERTMPIL